MLHFSVPLIYPLFVCFLFFLVFFFVFLFFFFAGGGRGGIYTG